MRISKAQSVLFTPFASSHPRIIDRCCLQFAQRHAHARKWSALQLRTAIHRQQPFSLCSSEGLCTADCRPGSPSRRDAHTRHNCKWSLGEMYQGSRLVGTAEFSLLCDSWFNSMLILTADFWLGGQTGPVRVIHGSKSSRSALTDRANDAIRLTMASANARHL